MGCCLSDPDLLQAAAALLSEPFAELQRRTHEGAIEYGLAEVVTFQDAPRVSRNLCTNAVIPLMDSFTDVCPSLPCCMLRPCCETLGVPRPARGPACAGICRGGCCLSGAALST